MRSSANAAAALQRQGALALALPFQRELEHGDILRASPLQARERARYGGNAVATGVVGLNGPRVHIWAS